ncbi:hypothetical protein [Methanobacterium oryzae]|uniref:hypothetical protein n=1 Tax=Methanobacterium oryzae TaxID=69540 RepID=UPI003D1B6C6B
MVSREDEDKIDEFIKYRELEKNIINTVKESELDHLGDNICKLGFIKIFESEDTSWFLYEDTKYILILEDDSGLYLYE